MLIRLKMISSSPRFSKCYRPQQVVTYIDGENYTGCNLVLNIKEC